MPLQFGDASRAWDATLKAVIFPAKDGNQPVRCIVGAESLAEHFGMAKPEEMDALRAFDRSRPVIEAAASRKYDRWKLAGSGEVSLRKRDFG
ncbi:MAG TPA: DUF1488 domain-containing protein [Alphaproteobacteria bacterium]|nr:DUF1488 domain-containing protein [Alphaproteobacteria bacterium]